MCPVASMNSPAASDAAAKALFSLQKAVTVARAQGPAALGDSPFQRLAAQLPRPRPVARSLSGERYTFQRGGVVAFHNDELRREAASRIQELRCTAALGEGSINAQLALKALKYRKLAQQAQTPIES